MRRSAVLSRPLQLVFPGLRYMNVLGCHYSANYTVNLNEFDEYLEAENTN